MKKITLKVHLLSAIMICSLSAVIMSCTDKNELLPIEESTDEYLSVIMTLPSVVFEDDNETKMAGQVADGQMKYIWTETDTVGIFPTSGSQIYFSMASGAGETSATFDGGGWALKKGFEYYSYYPFVPSYYIEKEAIPFSYLGQVQNGNGVSTYAHLGKYCYMAAKGEADENTGSLYFEYKRIGVLYRFTIPVIAGEYKSLTLSIEDSHIAQSGTYKAITIDQAIYNPVYTNEITLSFENMTFENSGTLIAYMMLPPFNVLNKQVNYELTLTDNTTIISSVNGKNYALGKAYNNAPHFSVYPGYAEIDSGGGSQTVSITASGSDGYSVSTGADWITLSSHPTSGTSEFTVTAAKNESGAERQAEVIVSEVVNGVTLQNIITIHQDKPGLKVNIGDWENNGNDEGGTAV